MTRARLHEWMKQRREYKRKGWEAEFEAATRACRKCVWAIKGVPPMKWHEMEKHHV